MVYVVRQDLFLEKNVYREDREQEMRKLFHVVKYIRDMEVHNTEESFFQLGHLIGVHPS